MQQREAFILHYGERQNSRYLAVAMDCSTEAAANHLKAATDSLRAIAGPEFGPFTAQLAHCYTRLTPSEQLVLPSIKSVVRRYVWPRRIALRGRRTDQ